MSIRVFVANLPFQTSETDLRTFFSTAEITPLKATIVRDRFSGEAKGFAWVEVASEEEAQQAVGELRGKQFYGRTIVVTRARELEASAPGNTVRPDQ
jgi:cold-inducible RNA-binding protein